MNLRVSDFAVFNMTTSSGVGLVKVGDPDPRTYARFAEEDLEQADSPRNRINALSNAKRALHLQIELLTDALGFKRWKGERELRGFPRRLKFAEECGLIAPRILAGQSAAERR